MSDEIGDPIVSKCKTPMCSYEVSSMTYARFGPVNYPSECPICGNGLKEISGVTDE